MDIETIFHNIHVMLCHYCPEKRTALNKTVREKKDPFKVLIATILSHRTRDESTARAVNQLFSVYEGVKDLAEGDLNEIQRLIKQAGFYRVKAERIKRTSQMILTKFKGRVPDNLNDLLTLPSVGRKTANCVMVYGFGKPAIPVDTHVHRICNRLGLVRTKRPEETEQKLEENLKKEYWLEINELFVKFGQVICRPLVPLCIICLLNKACFYYQSRKLKITKPK